MCLHSPLTQHHPDRLSKLMPPQEFDWDSGCSSAEEGIHFIESAAANTFGGWNISITCKILFTLEPIHVYDSYNALEQYHDFSDIVLTTYRVPFRHYPFIIGSTWISESDQKLHRKSKHCSFIFSSKNLTVGHRLRHDINNQLSERFSLGIFGSGHRPIDDKIVALKDFRFTIVVENSINAYYFTEKLIDAFLTGTVPIYWGTDFIGTLFDISGILRFRSLGELEDILENIDSSLYDSMYLSVKKNFNIAREFRYPEQFLYKSLLAYLLPR